MQRIQTQAIAGFVSGTVTRLIVAPFDVVKIRMQIQVRNRPIKKSSPSHGVKAFEYKGVLQSLRYIKSREGLKGLYRGTLPGVSLWATYALIQFPTYQITQQIGSNVTENKFIRTFIGGAIASLVAQTITYPFDTIRTRYVSLDMKTAQKGYFSLVSAIIRKEGILGLHAGLYPSLLQVVPGMALTFMFYETINLDFAFGNQSGLSSLARGAIAGFLSKLIIYPLDTFKKRLQLNGTVASVPHYSGLMNCATLMLKEEGIVSFYRGLGATLTKSTISTACSFYVYESVNAYLGSKTIPKFRKD